MACMCMVITGRTVMKWVKWLVLIALISEILLYVFGILPELDKESMFFLGVSCCLLWIIEE